MSRIPPQPRSSSIAGQLSVARLSVTPVRSTALQHPESIELTEHGARNDRRFTFLGTDGRVFDAIAYGRLLQVHASVEQNPERLTLRFPDGHAVSGDVRLGEPASVEIYGRRFAVREVIGPWSRAVSEFSGRDVSLVRSERPPHELDRQPVSLVSTASLDELARQATSGTPVDARRFRMLIEIGGGDPHQEDGWIGTELRLGSATVRITVPDARCAITTLNPGSGIRDFATLHAIKAYRGIRDRRHIDFGVYADVLVPGIVRVGDRVTPETASR